MQQLKAKLHHRFSRNEARLPLAALGVLCGILAGLAANLFRLVLESPFPVLGIADHYDDFEALPGLAHFLLPLGGGLLLAALFHCFPSGNREIGVPHVIDYVQNSRGPMPLKNTLLQFLGASIALLSGQSCGREGPGIHLGAAVSSYLGQRLQLPNNVLRLLLACGSASAIGALFNTPIAGVIFAMEVVLMEYSIAGFTHIILAAVSGTVVTQLLHGDERVFMLADVGMNSLAEIPFVIFMGLFIGVLASLFIRLQSLSLSLSSIDIRKRLALAGLMTGALAFFIPEVMGSGYDSLARAVAGEYSLLFLALLLGAKLLLTPVVLGLGMPGGFIGMTLMIGGICGALLGSLGDLAMPAHHSDTGFYVLLGMCAMMGAVMQAPLAALMATLEISNNSNLILPAMLIIVVANLTASEGFGFESIYQVILRSRGIKTPNNLARLLSRYAVSSIMNSDISVLDLGAGDWPERLERLQSGESAWVVILPPATPDDDTKPHESRLISTDALGRLSAGSHDEATLMRLLYERSAPAAMVSLQSTLQQALDLMQRNDLQYCCVRSPVSLGQTRPLGFLSADAIMSFYQDR